MADQRQYSVPFQSRCLLIRSRTERFRTDINPLPSYNIVAQRELLDFSARGAFSKWLRILKTYCSYIICLSSRCSPYVAELCDAHCTLVRSPACLSLTIGSAVAASQPEYARLTSNWQGKPLRGSALPFHRRGREGLQPHSHVHWIVKTTAHLANLSFSPLSACVEFNHHVHLDAKQLPQLENMDPLSITASAIALIQVAGSVSQHFLLRAQ